MNLTQYLESQEVQDMTRLLYLTRTQAGRREDVSMCLGMEENCGLYSSGGESINGKTFNEG